MFYNALLFVFEWGFFVRVSKKEGEHEQERNNLRKHLDKEESVWVWVLKFNPTQGYPFFMNLD